jgi:LacI family transcriptional regulator/LacI family repressor for deo operon, udp, cdd, tsx, nupC, and nupG
LRRGYLTPPSRDSPLISEDVRKRIQRITEEMGYVPNTLAQSLKTNRTNCVGLVVTTIADPFVGRVVRGIEEVAQQNHLSIFLSSSHNEPEREIEVIKTLHQRRVDGLIIAATKLGDEYEQALLRMDVPTVLINHQTEAKFESLQTVFIDDYSGAYRAVEYLTQLGHRCIGYIGAGNRPRSNRIRLEAYQKALQDAGIEPDERRFRIASPQHRFHNEDVADGQNLSAELIRSGVTAIFCYNDMIAVGVLLTCRQLGISVPGQLSIIGFDDIELAQYVTPPLTTIHQPKLRLGQLAMEMLVDLLANRTVQNSVLPTDLVVRSSTGVGPEARSS